MPAYDEFQEEEFTTQFNGRVVARMLRLLEPYWTWVAGFMLLIVLCTIADSGFTWLSKRISNSLIHPWHAIEKKPKKQPG